MNLLLYKIIVNLISPKKAFHLVVLVFIFVLSLPLMAVVVLTNAGIPAVSDKLASINIQGHTIAIHDPTGKIIAQIQTQTMWPLHGVVTLEFGESDLPYQPFHTGIDIAGKYGTQITPFIKGTVIEVGHLSWGYGNYVVIDHGNNVTSLYGHMSQTEATKGQVIQPGDVIGLEGQSGWATGPHVHFEIRVFGLPVNPRTFMQGNL